jgi:hypothetical protein
MLRNEGGRLIQINTPHSRDVVVVVVVVQVERLSTIKTKATTTFVYAITYTTTHPPSSRIHTAAPGVYGKFLLQPNRQCLSVYSLR